MDITRAVSSEAEALTTIAIAAKAHWKYPEHWIAQWRPLLTISPAFIDANDTFAARDAGAILGWAALVRNGDRLDLEHLWVLPSVTGRGVGRLLFRHAQQQARNIGFGFFETESDPNAAGFYQRMGGQWVRNNVTRLEGQPRELPVFRFEC